MNIFEEMERIKQLSDDILGKDIADEFFSTPAFERKEKYYPPEESLDEIARHENGVLDRQERR